MDPYESNRSVTVARQSLDGSPSFAEEIERLQQRSLIGALSSHYQN